MIQGGQEEAPMRQGLETKVMKEGTRGATSQAGHMMSSRKQGKVVGPRVEEASQEKPHLTRSGRNNSRRRSHQGSNWFCTCLILQGVEGTTAEEEVIRAVIGSA